MNLMKSSKVEVTPITEQSVNLLLSVAALRTVIRNLILAIPAGSDSLQTHFGLFNFVIFQDYIHGKNLFGAKHYTNVRNEMQ